MNTMRKEMDKAREENRTEQSEREEELSIYSISIWFSFFVFCVSSCALLQGCPCLNSSLELHSLYLYQFIRLPSKNNHKQQLQRHWLCGKDSSGLLGPILCGNKIQEIALQCTLLFQASGIFRATERERQSTILCTTSIESALRLCGGVFHEFESSFL